MADQNKPTAATIVNFGLGSIDQGGPGADDQVVTLALDTAKNAEVYGANKSSFAPTEMAYLYILPHGSYQLQSSAGVVTKQGSNIPFAQTETLTFADSAVATLDYVPMGPVSWQWLGRDGGIPLISGQAVTVPEAIVGVLQVTYDSAGDRIGLEITIGNMNGLEELPVVVVVENDNGDNANTTVTFTLDGEDAPVQAPTEIEVTDFCSGNIVVGATVYVDGVEIGVTNSAGLVYAGMLVPGQTYALKVVADGFADSDRDVLNNDSFVVP